MRFDPVLVDFHSARTSRKHAWALGKIRTIWVLRLISWLSLSSMLVLLRCL